MKLDLHMLCWNESYLLPSVLSYYSQHVDSITVYDNHSTDGSQEIAKSFGAKVIPFGIPGQLNDLEYLKIKNGHKANSDWVIICDADEVLYHPSGLRNAWQDSVRENATYLRTKGFNIYSDAHVTENILDINTGFPYEPFNKNVCFNSQRVKPFYLPGAHHWRPKGFVRPSNTNFYLMHYRCIGGVDRMVKRHAEYEKRLSDYNRQNKFGIHYLRKEKAIKKEWSENISKSKAFIPF